MPKRTAVIDIGSNSARLVIYERTSRYGFHLVCEQKSKVRISEGAYQHSGFLQPVAMQRAYFALSSFMRTIKKYQVRKVQCVATSALRDAPNASAFIHQIKQKLGLHIKVIDGDTEAFYGGIAAANLLPLSDAITVDIGGGSADLARIVCGKVVQTYSLDLGTVRLKELFYDRHDSPKEAAKTALAHIDQALYTLPKTFQSPLVVAIGGSARALSKAIMKLCDYPFKKLHAFEYAIQEWEHFLEAIPYMSHKKLKKTPIKKSRHDTIREGALIFIYLLRHIGAKRVITSSVGVREGVFLSQLLRSDKYKYPATLNPSVVSILDRFPSPLTKGAEKKIKVSLATKLMNVLPIPQETKQYTSSLTYALHLSGIGNTLNIYDSHRHAFYIASYELNYRFDHREIVLIASLLKMYGKERIDEMHYNRYAPLLPPREILVWLSFIYTLSISLYEASADIHVNFSYQKHRLTIQSRQSLYLAQEKIDTIEKPITMDIVFEQDEKFHIISNQTV